MVMTDLEEPFVPLSEGLFVDPYESKYGCLVQMTVIPHMLTRTGPLLPLYWSNYQLYSPMSRARSLLCYPQSKLHSLRYKPLVGRSFVPWLVCLHGDLGN